MTQPTPEQPAEVDPVENPDPAVDPAEVDDEDEDPKAAADRKAKLAQTKERAAGENKQR